MKPQGIASLEYKKIVLRVPMQAPWEGVPSYIYDHGVKILKIIWNHLSHIKGGKFNNMTEVLFLSMVL